MCIIAICAKRKLNEEELEACFRNNPDGAGIAWSVGTESNYVKGLMNLSEVKELYSSIYVLPHIVHFRKATSGGIKPQLTHPFIISRISPLPLKWSGKDPLLFHNGMFSRWEDDMMLFYLVRKQRIPDGDWSDSRFLAILCHALGENVLKFKKNGKYVTLNKGKITMYGDFAYDSGVYFSNDSYKKIQRAPIHFNRRWWFEHDEWSENKMEAATPYLPRNNK